MVGRLEGTDHDILWESVLGTREVRPLRQIIFEDASARRIPVPIVDQAFENPGVIMDFLEVDGAVDPKPISVFAAPHEQKSIEDLVAALGFNVRADWSETALPVQTVRLAVRAPLGEYERGVAKVAFHYVLTVFPDLVGTDSEFSAIREFIWEGGLIGNCLVTQEEQQIVYKLQDGYRPTHWSHLLFATRIHSGDILAHVQLFAGPEHLPLPFRVHIGRDPSRLFRPSERQAHQFVIGHPETPSAFDGCVVDLQPLNRVVIPFGFIAHPPRKIST